jgi:flagellar biosynthesis/type III secretory pathway chaperone
MESVKNASEELLLNMTGVLELIEELLNLSKQKASLLTAGDAEGLNTAVIKEEDIILSLHELENDRKTKADALAKTVGIFDKNITLKEIVSKIEDEHDRKGLSEVREKLQEAISRLSEQNAKLKELLEIQIGLTDYTLNMLYIPKRRNHSYDKTGGRSEDTGELSLMDIRI